MSECWNCGAAHPGRGTRGRYCRYCQVLHPNRTAAQWNRLFPRQPGEGPRMWDAEWKRQRYLDTGSYSG